jgi:hypothetical protein
VRRSYRAACELGTFLRPCQPAVSRMDDAIAHANKYGGFRHPHLPKSEPFQELLKIAKRNDGA